MDEDGGAAFTLMPPTFDQFVDVADRREHMPAKATYFDPKPQSGLFLRLGEGEAGGQRLTEAAALASIARTKSPFASA